MHCYAAQRQEEDLRLLFAHVFQTCAVLLMLCFSLRSEPEAQLSVMLTL